MRVQLIIEGGGMRGVYTAGVLDFLMEKQIKFLNVIGVSSGACNAISYKSWQPHRNIEIYINYARDKRYYGIRSLLRHGNIFGFDFIFDVIPKELVYFNYDYFKDSPINVEVVVTNIKTGTPEYYEIKNMKTDEPYLRASCSIPFLSRVVSYKGKRMLDGGISDSIPIKYSLNSGYDKQIIVLTRDGNYRKKRLKTFKMARFRYPRHPKLSQVIKERYLKYNETLDLISELERKKQVMVIRPQKEVIIKRFEKNHLKLLDLYYQGYNDAKNKYEELINFITGATNVII